MLVEDEAGRFLSDGVVGGGEPEEKPRLLFPAAAVGRNSGRMYSGGNKSSLMDGNRASGYRMHAMTRELESTTLGGARRLSRNSW